MVQLFAIVCLVVACGERPATRSTTPPVARELGATTAPAPSTPVAAPDPWDQPATSADDPPSLVERQSLADEACPRVTAPHFYRIEKAGKVSHILGTRHVGVSLTKFPAVVHAQLDAAKLAVFEVAPDDDGVGSERELSLPDELGPELWERYRKLVGGKVADAMRRSTPTIALLQITVLYEDITATLDSEIERRVLAAKLPAYGLETSEFQLKLLQQLLDLRALRAALQHTETRDELAEETRRDLVEYCAGTDEEPGFSEDDIREMLASGYTRKEIERITDEILYARNARWIPKLEKFLARGHAFIAVGVDHLTGPRGVNAMLAARGYKITRVTPPARN